MTTNQLVFAADLTRNGVIERGQPVVICCSINVGASSAQCSRAVIDKRDGRDWTAG